MMLKRIGSENMHCDVSPLIKRCSYTQTVTSRQSKWDVIKKYRVQNSYSLIFSDACA